MNTTLNKQYTDFIVNADDDENDFYLLESLIQLKHPKYKDNSYLYEKEDNHRFMTHILYRLDTKNNNSLLENNDILSILLYHLISKHSKKKSKIQNFQVCKFYESKLIKRILDVINKWSNNKLFQKEARELYEKPK